MKRQTHHSTGCQRANRSSEGIPPCMHRLSCTYRPSSVNESEVKLCFLCKIKIKDSRVCESKGQVTFKGCMFLGSLSWFLRSPVSPANQFAYPKSHGSL